MSSKITSAWYRNYPVRQFQTLTTLFTNLNHVLLNNCLTLYTYQKPKTHVSMV